MKYGLGSLVLAGGLVLSFSVAYADVLMLTSSAIPDNGTLATKNACSDKQRSPNLTTSVIGNFADFADRRVAAGASRKRPGEGDDETRRMVAIEFGTCRSGRIGGASGSVIAGKGRSRQERGARRS